MLSKLFANRAHNLIGQFRLGACLAAKSALLFRTVAHIVGLRANGKMSRVHAARGVAAMKQMLRGGQGDAVMQFVAKPMSIHLEVAGCIESAIAVFKWPSPKPASFGLLNSFPKEYVLRLLKPDCIAFMATVFAAPAFNLAGLSRELITANGAGKSYGSTPRRASAGMATNSFVVGQKFFPTGFASAFHGYKYTIDAGV